MSGTRQAKPIGTKRTTTNLPCHALALGVTVGSLVVMPRHDLLVVYCIIYIYILESDAKWSWLQPFYVLAQFTAALPSTFLHHKAQSPNRCQVESIRDASGSSK